MLKQPKILVAMGSQSDWPTMEHCAGLLQEFSVAHETHIISAHRTPDRVDAICRRLNDGEFSLAIAGAGGAAHLAGAVAARTTAPVIGVPIAGLLQGFDSLLSTVQMPSGIPVATVSIGAAGAKNAALLAISIVAVGNADLRQKLADYRARLAQQVPLTPQSLVNAA